MNEQTTNNITRILELSVEILGTVRSLKERRSAYEGEPLLDFSEVCQLLHQSECGNDAKNHARYSFKFVLLRFRPLRCCWLLRILTC